MNDYGVLGCKDRTHYQIGDEYSPPAKNEAWIIVGL